MINVQISLPDEVARKAKEAGLLSDETIQALLEDALRRAAGNRMLTAAKDIRSATIEPISDDEIVALVGEVRNGRRAQSGMR